MIQRIQTVYLLFGAIASCLLFGGNYLMFIDETGRETLIKFSGIYQQAGNGMVELIKNFLPVTAIIALIPLLALIAIFFFKNRKLQIRITYSLIFLEIVLILLTLVYVVSFTSRHSYSIKPGFIIIMPLISLILFLLACRSIKKDDELVKSYDRLR
ncbi:MAG: DUF4293 domain-containing protein [Bacteroidales bacterium]|jgi:hypothetical protein